MFKIENNLSYGKNPNGFFKLEKINAKWINKNHFK
jgi:hypothetical protein